MAKPDAKKRLKVLALVAQGLYQTKIAKVLNITSPAARKLLKALEKEGYLKQISRYPALYNLTAKGRVALARNKILTKDFNQSSLPVRPSQHQKHHIGKNRTTPVADDYIFTAANLHDFKVKIPILKHGKLEGVKTVQINNWAKQYLSLNLPYPLTLEITTKNIILHFKQIKLPKDSTFYQALFKFYTTGLTAAASFLATKGFILDIVNAKVISQHIANQTGDTINKKLPQSTVVEVKFNRSAKAIPNRMDQQASAWIDRSHGVAEVETNDLTYEEKLILMPERIELIQRHLSTFLTGMDKYSKNIELHLSVLSEMKSHLKALTTATEELAFVVKKLADFKKAK